MDGFNPYPSNTAIREEAAAAELIERQTLGIDAFAKACAAFVSAVKACDWPLGCPVNGYDWEDIIAIAEVDWTDLCAPDEALAFEIVRVV